MAKFIKPNGEEVTLDSERIKGNLVARLIQMDECKNVFLKSKGENLKRLSPEDQISVDEKDVFALEYKGKLVR